MNNLSDRERRLAIDALTMLRRQANNREIEVPNYGICYALWILLGVWRDNGNISLSELHTIHTTVCEHMAQWPDGTGSSVTPIPSSYKHISADDQYHSDHNKWGGKQLKYRIALMRWLIKELKR